MGARTPDAYRIGAGQVTQEYPADAVPARLRKQPSLPTMSHAPESSPVEQVVTAEVAVVRRKASVPPRQTLARRRKPPRRRSAMSLRATPCPRRLRPPRNLLRLRVSMRIWMRPGWPSRAIIALAFPFITTGAARRCAS